MMWRVYECKVNSARFLGPANVTAFTTGWLRAIISRTIVPIEQEASRHRSKGVTAANPLPTLLPDLRKDGGFEIADRIRTYYAGDDVLRAAMRAFEDYVRNETLSVEVIESAPPPDAQAETASIDGREVTLGVVRV